MYLAKGTVKSYLKPSSLFPWSLSLKVSFNISEPPAYFDDKISNLSRIGVSKGARLAIESAGGTVEVPEKQQPEKKPITKQPPAKSAAKEPANAKSKTKNG